ncbi:hypothetical protein R0G64_32750, partial [Pseudomonas otitidis]|nr:hypothetical protein [Pseudomonas otitidis]
MAQAADGVGQGRAHAVEVDLAQGAAERVQVAQVLGGRYFEYLLGRFTEPSELFGPVDLRKLREGTV